MDLKTLYGWYVGNLYLLRKIFGNGIDYAGDFSWVVIHQFPLPPKWVQVQTPLLIVLPGLKGSIYTKPDRFYVDKRLKTISGKIPNSIHVDDWYNDLRSKNYARYSFHLKQWEPSPDIVSGDNLINLVETVYTGMQKLADETEAS